MCVITSYCDTNEEYMAIRCRDSEAVAAEEDTEAKRRNTAKKQNGSAEAISRK